MINAKNLLQITKCISTNKLTINEINIVYMAYQSYHDMHMNRRLC